jgi:ATP-dependent DNA ligase
MNNFKEEGFLLAQGFQRFHGQLAPLLLGLWQGRNMVGGRGRGKLLTSCQLGSGDRKEERKMYPAKTRPMTASSS